MYNYLVADYILGYSLSSDNLFSAVDISRELNMPAGPISKIFFELYQLNKHWFEITGDSPGNEMKIVRKKEYDDEIIQWLINGESKNYYKETEMIDSTYYPIKQRPLRKPILPLKPIWRVISYISKDQIKKVRKWVLKYIFSIKDIFRTTSKR